MTFCAGFFLEGLSTPLEDCDSEPINTESRVEGLLDTTEDFPFVPCPLIFLVLEHNLHNMPLHHMSIT